MCVNEYLKNWQAVCSMNEVVKAQLMETGVKIDVTECIQSIEPFAKTLNCVENNFRVCLQNDLKNATHCRNFIVAFVEHSLDILDEIKDNALHCRDNHKTWPAVLECAENVSPLNLIYKKNIL